jgi:hypothetical protein
MFPERESYVVLSRCHCRSAMPRWATSAVAQYAVSYDDALSENAAGQKDAVQR